MDLYSLDKRLSAVERRTLNYSSNVEPKTWEYKGQTWYDESTEVLNAWNGREYTPAYGKSIVQDLDDNRTAIEQNTSDISLRVEKGEILAEINLSTEWVRIDGDKIKLNGDVLVDGSFTLDSISDGTIYQRVNTNEKTGAARAYNSINEFERYSSWLLWSDFDPGVNPSTGLVIDSAGLRLYKAGLNTINLDQNGDAYFRGNIYAVNGTFTWSITSSATITWGTIIGSTIKTDTGTSSGHYDRVQIWAGTNKMQVFDSNNTEILNIWYNVSWFNNIFWTTVGNDGFTGPIVFVKSARNANVLYIENNNSWADDPTAYFKTNGTNNAVYIESTSSSNSDPALYVYNNGTGNTAVFRTVRNVTAPAVYAQVNSISNVGLETNGRIFASGNIISNWDLNMWWDLKGSGRIRTYGSADIWFYNTSRMYLRYSNTYFKVETDGTLFWNDWSWEREVAFV